MDTYTKRKKWRWSFVDGRTLGSRGKWRQGGVCGWKLSMDRVEGEVERDEVDLCIRDSLAEVEESLVCVDVGLETEVDFSCGEEREGGRWCRGG